MVSDEIIYSDDFTRVVSYQSRQFTLGDISLAAINGLQWNAVPSAVGTAAALAVPPAALLWLLGLSPIWALLVPPIPALVIYLRGAKERRGGLSEREKRQLRRNARRQPKHLLGMARDTEATSFRWHITLYEPAPASQPTATRYPQTTQATGSLPS